jgi:inositol transport system substrate-binding protein
MKKKIAILLSIFMILMIFSGCSLNKSSSSNNKNIKIFVSMSNDSDAFRHLLSENAKSYAQSKNVELVVKDAAGSIEKQVEHMKEAVSGGYNVVVCGIVNPDTALQLKKTAGNLPILFINSAPSDDLLEVNKYIYVASNEMVAGRYQAESVIESLKNKSEAKIVLFKGEEGHSGTIGRTKAVKQTFKEKGVNAKYVFEDFANWSRKGAKEMFDVFLSTHKEFDAVICNNDEMALGVIDSLKENKIDSASVPVLGIDATPDGCKAIVDGSMKLSVYQSAEGQAKSFVDAAIQLGSDGSLENIENLADDKLHVWVPFEKVDKSNVKQYMK